MTTTRRKYLTGFLVAAALLMGTLIGQESSATIRGQVFSEADAHLLPGASIVLASSPVGELVAETLTNDEGRFELPGVSPGVYRLTVSLPGFQQQIRDGLEIAPGASLELSFSLAVAQLEENIEVVGDRESERAESATSGQTMRGELVDIVPVKGDEFQGLLPLTPGVLRAADGRIVMKGGSPTQSSLVVNSSTDVTDPATGDFGFNLPSDAVESVDILPNPYAAEYGRFSSGTTNILTRQGTPKWKFLFNNFFPRPRFRDGHIVGLGGFTPRLSIRGPLVKDRLWVAQTFQYRFLRTRVPAQPSLRNDIRLESFDSFTQLDAVLNDRHTLTAIVSFFPRKLDFANLDTFNALDVTANLHQRGWNVGLSERFVLTPQAVLESTVSLRNYDVDVFGQGLDEMFILPDENQGSFFNIQRRNTQTLQWVEAVSLVREGRGEHHVRIGFDLLDHSFDGLSQSRPVSVLRADGTLSQRLEYSPATSQRVRNTDFAVFGQDRWRLNDRFILEYGARLDRDGVLKRNNFSPRLGMVIGVLPDGAGILRGGAGLFYDRTPLNVAAFGDYERPTLTRYGQDGQTIQEVLPFGLESAPDMRTPYSLTWNVEYDHRINKQWLFKTNFLRRKGFHEFVIDPLEAPLPLLRLDSRGRSRYWEWEFTGRYQPREDSHLLLTYVRSSAQRDLNSFDSFFGNFRNPIIRPNEFSRADIDTPHRFILQGTMMLPGKWIFSPVVEIRQGFPYSLLDEERDYVGPRNLAGRFPLLKTVDIDIQRWFKIWKWKTRLGIRIFNALGTFNPRDFQGNVDAARFGVFSNTIPRLFGGTFQIEP